MQNNYFFLRKLCLFIESHIIGSTLVKCYSQSKDELIFEFRDNNEEYFIKAHLSSRFSCLYFPHNFSRTRRNSIDLFPEIVGERVNKIETLQYERGFFFYFENDLVLFFKLFGNRSNIVLFKDGDPVDLFHKKMIKDQDLRLDMYTGRTIPDLDKILTYQDLKKDCPFLLGVPEYYMMQEKWEDLANSKKVEFIKILIEHLNTSNQFYTTRINNITHLSMLKTGDTMQEFNNPVDAINNFFITYLKTSEIDSLKKEWLTKLNKKASGVESYLRKNRKRLNDLENKLEFGKIADLIMANLYRINKGDQKIELEDFENPEEKIAIRLKPSLSPQKNAENYYRKAKNQSIEIKNLKSNIKAKEKEYERLSQMKSNIEETNDVKKLRSLVKDLSGSTIRTEVQSESLPYYQHEIEGFSVLVGKSAKGNDTLLQKFTSKNDLWLHAKDTQGSHVIIKKKGAQQFSKQVIEKAAQLAAQNSKRKGESLCPVSYTERKYVRKRKGDPPGAVVVDREKVLMVVPSDLK